MAGGLGRRLWPLSRCSRPKPFVTPPGTGKSFLAQTAARCAFIPPDRTFVSTNTGLEGLVMREISDLPASNIIFEYEKRNTLPSIVFSLAHIAALYADATVLIVASDTFIGDNSMFKVAVSRAMNAAEAGANLVSIGVRPESPSTRFGYMALGEGYPALVDTWFGTGYVEKPSLDLAQNLFTGGRHDWNTGVFAWTTSTFALALESYVPEVHRTFELIGEAKDHSTRAALYNSLPMIDIDHGLFEQVSAKSGSVRHVFVRGSYRWSDLGTFDTFAQLLPRDNFGNRLSSGVTLTDTSNSVVINESKRLIVARGLYDQLVVVSDIGDVLVTPNSKADEIESVYEDLGSNDSLSLIKSKASVDCIVDGARAENIAFLNSRGVRITMEDERISISQGARVFVAQDDVEFARVGSRLVVDAIASALLRTPGEVLITMSAGKTPVDIYASLRIDHRFSVQWKRVHFVQMDEWAGVGIDDPRSFAHELRLQLIEPLGMRATLLNGLDNETAVVEIEDDVLARGGFAFALHGIGVNGHLGFVEPSRMGHAEQDLAHVAELAHETKYMARTRFNGSSPSRGLTLGLRSIARASKTLLIARGSEKASAIGGAMGMPSVTCPASLLQKTGALDLLIDLEASEKIRLS